MILVDTQQVTPKNGPRPAGDPGVCFYCQQPIGASHSTSCVLRKRTVVVSVTTELLIEVPEDWDVRMLEFHMNDSTSCANNLLNKVTEQLSRIEAQSNGCECACQYTSAKFLREADSNDHEIFKADPRGRINDEKE